MTLEILTFDEEGEQWTTGNVSKHWISAAWEIPNREGEVNIIIGGMQLTVIMTKELHKYLQSL
jgi:hypothetical protein